MKHISGPADILGERVLGVGPR
ncbi:protein of unknown function (plasmid) [Cupriavidus taiwanensis]|uniref:Uncharacterized protein n=1 Tax=Cupriavidus taiwanensis TaxID=164546 RepID=A0A375IRY1_9BURK|nr:protein of unknown function [Cupriavidus taiwanensis]